MRAVRTQALISIPVLVLWLVLAAAAPAAVAAPAPSGPAAQARLASCGTGTAVFEGRMRAVGTGTRLQMLFQLEASTSTQPGWRGVPAPGFDAWTTAQPGVDRYVYTKRVEGLVAPGRYRAVIRFRWLDAAGRRVARARRATPTCRQAVRPAPQGARSAPLYFIK